MDSLPTRLKRAAKYANSMLAMGRLLAHFRAGEDTDDQGEPVTIERIASELVGRYRALGCCLDRNGTSWDGPLIADVKEVLRAAVERGKG